MASEIDLAINCRSINFTSFFVRLLMNCWVSLCAALAVFIFVFWLSGGTVAFILLAIVVCDLLYNVQDHLVFHPDDHHSRLFVHTPHVVELPFENLFIRSKDGTLINLYFITQPDREVNPVPTLVFLHGNAGNIGHRLVNAAGLYCNLHCNVLMVEYRGYGLSKGSPSESGVCMDAQAAMDFLSTRSDIDHRQIIIFGRSLGGAVAIDLAARAEYASKIWCVILENTFTSIPDMALALFNKWVFLAYIPLFCYKNKFISKEKVKCVSVPVLFVSGLSDSLVPPRMMRELYEACGSEGKRLTEVSQGGHNDTWTCVGYYQALGAFLNSVLDARPPPPRPVVDAV